MTHKLKTLGVALIAVLALTAVMASAASAANYTASKYPTTGTGTSAKGNDVFTTEGGTVKCASHFQGTLGLASSTLTVTAKYTECEAFGFLSATVNMGSCDYLFTTPVSGNAPVDVKCTDATKPITISTSGCTLTLGEQTTGGHTAITNNASDVSVQATVSAIDYTVTNDGFLCPFNGTGFTKDDGTYTQGSAITFASTNGAKIDIG